MQKVPSATKCGPGRKHKGGKPGTRLTKQRRKSSALHALYAAWASKRVPKWDGPRDDKGAVFLIGKPYALEGVHPSAHEVVLEGWVDGDDFGYTVQRKWLAGISAQRGY
ncbi:MAG: hypothetical protein V4669_13920 [Pseudomonadota bacterium]